MDANTLELDIIRWQLPTRCRAAEREERESDAQRPFTARLDSHFCRPVNTLRWLLWINNGHVPLGQNEPRQKTRTASLNVCLSARARACVCVCLCLQLDGRNGKVTVFWHKSSWDSTLLNIRKLSPYISMSLLSADVIVTSSKMPFSLYLG